MIDDDQMLEQCSTLRAMLGIHQSAHHTLMSHIRFPLSPDALAKIEGVALATTSLMKATAAIPKGRRPPAGRIRKSLYDYWQHLSYYTGKYPYAPGLEFDEVLPEQILLYAPEEMLSSLLAFQRYPRQARQLYEYRVADFAHRSPYILDGGHIVHAAAPTKRQFPRGHEMIDLYVEVGSYLERWAPVDPHLQIVSIAIEANRSVSGTLLASVTTRVDRVLAALQIP